MNLSTLTADFKVVRCNNVLTWIDEYGNVITLPCYLGTDITSTNNLIGKDGIVHNERLIILIQANDFTKSIVKNQRFMFEHSTAFKVEEVNNYMQEQGTDGQVTCIKIYINYSAITPNDNVELNICDYYDADYTIKINQENNIKQVTGFTGTLTATVKNIDTVVEGLQVNWYSSDNTVVKIDNNGNYEIVGNIVGNKAIITCCLDVNKEIKDSIEIEVVSSVVTNKVIVVNPNDIKLLKERDKVDFICNVYNEGDLQPDVVNCVGSGVPDNCYTLTSNHSGYKLIIHKKYNTPLILTFSATGCADYVMTIKLIGLL